MWKIDSKDTLQCKINAIEKIIVFNLTVLTFRTRLELYFKRSIKGNLDNTNTSLLITFWANTKTEKRTNLKPEQTEGSGRNGFDITAGLSTLVDSGESGGGAMTHLQPVVCDRSSVTAGLGPRTRHDLCRPRGTLRSGRCIRRRVPTAHL